MKYILILLLITLSFNSFSETRTYKFTRSETMAGNVNSLEGNVTFSVENNREFVSVDFAGNHKFNFWDDIEFKSSMPLKNGLELYDYRRKGSPVGFTIFAHHISLINYKKGFKTRDVETENRHPYFKDYSWRFYVNYEKNESLSINGKSYEAAFFTMKGSRPTGSENCRPGQPGVIKVQTWYEIETSLLLKQTVSKFMCKPADYNLLEKDTYTLQ